MLKRIAEKENSFVLCRHCNAIAYWSGKNDEALFLNDPCDCFDAAAISQVFLELCTHTVKKKNSFHNRLVPISLLRC